jgi:hypothetical protein
MPTNISRKSDLQVYSNYASALFTLWASQDCWAGWVGGFVAAHLR